MEWLFNAYLVVLVVFYVVDVTLELYRYWKKRRHGPKAPRACPHLRPTTDDKEAG